MKLCQDSKLFSTFHKTLHDLMRKQREIIVINECNLIQFQLKKEKFYIMKNNEGIKQHQAMAEKERKLKEG